MRFYNIDTAADATGLGSSTLRRYIATGALPVLRIGRRVLIEETALQEFITGTGQATAHQEEQLGGGQDADPDTN